MGRVRDAISGMSGGKGKLLILAGVCVAVGFLLNADKYLGGGQEISRGAPSPANSLQSNWTESSRVTEAAKERAHTWGDAAIRFGGSFMVAMIIGSLLRAFVRTMVIALLVAGGVLWYLDSKDLVEPFWEDAFHSWDHAKGWILAQTDSVKQFLQGYVPSMTSALLGFGFGFGLRK